MADSHVSEILSELPVASGSVVAAFLVVGAVSLCVLRLYSGAPRAGGEGLPSGSERPATDSETEMRPVRATELSVANGEDGCPLYVAVADPYSSRVTVFDMAKGREFYGPGGPYHLFAGRNATVGLAKSSLDPADVEGDLSQLSAHERDTHEQWYAKFKSKYPVVGYLVRGGETEIDETESAAMDAKKNE